MNTVLAQPDLPELPSDTVLQDPGSDSFDDDIFFDDFTLNNTDTAATTATDTTATATTAATTTPAATDTTTVSASATGPATNLVFWIAGALAILTLLIIRQVKSKAPPRGQRYE